MRRINLILAAIIGVIGTIIYFVSIPTVNEDGLINLQVEAGNEEVLENIYFIGSIDNYSQFYLDQDEMKTTGDLSYLESLDAPYSIELFNLQEQFPDFIDSLYYNQEVSIYRVLTGEDYLISSHIEYIEDSYYMDNNQVFLTALNKETQEMEEDSIVREDAPEGDHIQIVGMYEDYPTVKMVYLTNSWGPNTDTYESIVSLGEYNFETKNYSEERLFTGEGDFGTYRSEMTVFENHDEQLFGFFNHNLHDYQIVMMDYTTNELVAFDHEDKEYTIGDDGQLYSVETAVGETLLTQYDGSVDEVTHEVTLEQAISDYLSDERTSLKMEVIDNKLYAIQSTSNFEMEVSNVPPADLQVFDVETGERLLHAKIHFDENNEANAYGANVIKIGQK